MHALCATFALLMYRPGELEIVMGTALARWAEENSYTQALPSVWLREMSEQVRTYCERLIDSDQFEREAFEEDVFKLVTAQAVCFLPTRRSAR